MAATKTGITDDKLRITVTKDDESIPNSGIISWDMADGDMTGYTVSLGQLAGLATGLPEDGGITADYVAADDHIDDTAKSWVTDQWIGYYLRLFDSRYPGGSKAWLITNNTATRIHIYGMLGIGISPDAMVAQNSRYEIHAEHEWDFSSDGYDELTIKLEYVNTGANDGGTFWVKNLFLSVRSDSTTLPDEYFASVKGLKYGSWIDDDHTPDPALNEGDLIENPVYFVEALLLGWTEATIDNIDTAAFDAVATHRKDWKITRRIGEQKDIFEYIAEICREFCFAFFERGDGKFTVRRIDKTSDSVPTYGGKTFLMKGSETSFKIGRTPVKEIYNDFVLKYKVNAATGEAEKMLFCRSPNESSYASSYTNLASEGQDFWDLCHDAYTNFQQVNKWEYTAEWIRDDATAELFLKWIIWRFTQRRHEVSFTAPLSALALELCDEAKFTHDLMPAAMDSATRFRLTEQTIDPETDTIDCTLLEVA
ncbi:MAG: hypothetical protein PHI18_08975 [bacterium]|nr:hypothetical protein [bacterium]